MFSQNTSVPDGTWYLQNLIVDHEESPNPVNSQNTPVTSNFENHNRGDKYLSTSICDYMGAVLNFDLENGNFTITDIGITLGGCVFDENISNPQSVMSFENKLYSFYSNESIFNYDIIEESSSHSQTLTITDINGNKAIYSNKRLSSKDFVQSHVSVFPIPAKEELTISSIHVSPLKFQIFDFSRKIVMAKQLLSSNSINVEKLPTGIYFIRIENKQGSTIVKKITK